MKILVGIKRVVDYNVRIRVKNDGSGIETDGVKMSINPFDEIALEEALRMKEAGKAEEVIVFSAGGNECQQQLRTGLAMGADRAIQVDTDQPLQPLTAARAMLALVRREERGPSGVVRRGRTGYARAPERGAGRDERGMSGYSGGHARASRPLRPPVRDARTRSARLTK